MLGGITVREHVDVCVEPALRPRVHVDLSDYLPDDLLDVPLLCGPQVPQDEEEVDAARVSEVVLRHDLVAPAWLSWVDWLWWHIRN